MAESDNLWRRLSPEALKKLGQARLGDFIEAEARRARPRVDTWLERHPSASKREVAQRAIDEKKNVASLVGGVTGVFGLASVPVDLLGMVYLQLSLLTEVATVYEANLRSESAREELLQLFGYANGIGPLERASPRVLGTVAGVLLTRGGLSQVGRALPLVAAPVAAYLNNQHIQAVGDAAIRHYDGFRSAGEKSRQQTDG